MLVDVVIVAGRDPLREEELVERGAGGVKLQRIGEEDEDDDADLTDHDDVGSRVHPAGRSRDSSAPSTVLGPKEQVNALDEVAADGRTERQVTENAEDFVCMRVGGR